MFSSLTSACIIEKKKRRKGVFDIHIEDEQELFTNVDNEEQEVSCVQFTAMLWREGEGLFSHFILRQLKSVYITKIKWLEVVHNQQLYSCLTFQNWETIKCNQDILVEFRVNTFKLQLNLWCHKPEPMKAHIIGHWHSLNGCLVMSYYLLPPVNHHLQADLFSYHNYNDRLRLANQKPTTNYIINQFNFWNVEIENLTTENCPKVP